MAEQNLEPTITVRGNVPDQMVAYGRKHILAVVEHAAVPVLMAELRLDHHADPARTAGYHVEMTIDLDGTPLRARRSAQTMTEAIDGASARLRRRMEAALERPQAMQLRHRDTASWQHDDQPSTRREFFPRPADERTVVRRKTFALRPESIDEAIDDLENLDHDFFLFVHDLTHAEAVVYRTGHGYGLMQRVETPEAIKDAVAPLELGPHPPRTTLKDAVAILDETGAPFEFFIDSINERGIVAYRRYDGNYGLIVPD